MCACVCIRLREIKKKKKRGGRGIRRNLAHSPNSHSSQEAKNQEPHPGPPEHPQSLCPGLQVQALECSMINSKEMELQISDSPLPCPARRCNRLRASHGRSVRTQPFCSRPPHALLFLADFKVMTKERMVSASANTHLTHKREFTSIPQLLI